jgi:hypothetical protein
LNRIGQRDRFGFGHTQNVKRETLSTLAANAGKPPKLFDELRNGAGVLTHVV